MSWASEGLDQRQTKHDLLNGQNLKQTHEPDYLNGPINLDNVERVEVVVVRTFEQASHPGGDDRCDHPGCAWWWKKRAAAGNDLVLLNRCMAGNNGRRTDPASFSFTTEGQTGLRRLGYAEPPAWWQG